MRDYSRFSTTCFNNELSAMNWNQIILNNENNIDKLFSSFYKTLNNVVNKHAPVKTVSRRKMKQISKPWISSGIRTAIKIKHKLYAEGDRVRYKIYRNKIQKLIRLSKTKYYHDFFNIHLSNIKKTWEGINGILNRKTKKSHNHILSLKDPENSNTTTNDPSQIPQKLNKHFASIGSKLACKIPDAEKHFSDYLADSKSPQKSFSFNPITTTEVKLEILYLPNNKSYGLYSCPTQILKCASDILGHIITTEIYLIGQLNWGNILLNLKCLKLYRYTSLRIKMMLITTDQSHFYQILIDSSRK